MENLVERKPLLIDKEKFLRDIASGFEKGQAFLTALEIDLFTNLKETKSCEQISLELGIHPGVNKRFLDMLVAMELLDRKNDLYSTPSELLPFLSKEEDYFIQSLHYLVESRDDWIQLPERLQKGPIEKPENKNKWNYSRKRVNWMARRILLGRLQAAYKNLSVIPGFNAAKKMIDLGGNHGIFAIGFAQMNPELEIVIFDQPGVTDISQEFINEYGLQKRASTITGDYLKEDIGLDYDIAFCAMSFSGNKEDARFFYRKVAASLNKGGLFILETIAIDNDKKGPLYAVSSGLREYMNGKTDECFFTEKEHLELLIEAGLAGEQIVDMSECWGMPTKMIIARK